MQTDGDVDDQNFIIRTYQIFFKSGEHLEFKGQWNALGGLPGISELLQDYRTFLDTGAKPNPSKRYVILGSTSPKKSAEFMVEFDQVVSIAIIFDEGLVK